MDLIKFKIVTPEKIVYEETIGQVTVPTTTGSITILPHHIPLMSILQAGELVIKKDGKDIPLAVSSGFIQVNNNEVIILADSAETAENIDEARAEEAKLRAQKLLAEMKNTEDVNYTALAAKIEKELARLHVARKHKSRSSHPHLSP